MREGSRAAPGASGSKEELVQEGFQEEASCGSCSGSDAIPEARMWCTFP